MWTAATGICAITCLLYPAHVYPLPRLVSFTLVYTAINRALSVITVCRPAYCVCISCRWCCWKKLRLKHSAQRTNCLWRKSWLRKQKRKTLHSFQFLILVRYCHAVTGTLKMGAYRSWKIMEWNLKFKFSRPVKSWNQTYILESHGKSSKWFLHFDLCIPKPGLAGGLCPNALGEPKRSPRPPNRTWQSHGKPLSVFYTHPV